MKTNTTTPVVSNTPTPATMVPGGFTLGLDLGDRSHHVCVLDATGQIVREGALSNTRPALKKLLTDFPCATVALEAGTHSPWISRYLTDLGAHVLVANPRKLHAISRNERKCDQRDAQMLARLARVDPALLYPIQHGTAHATSNDNCNRKPDSRIYDNDCRSCWGLCQFELAAANHPRTTCLTSKHAD